MLAFDGKQFDWDRNKNLININKHGISFKEAATVFQDKYLIEIDDLEHSQESICRTYEKRLYDNYRLGRRRFSGRNKTRCRC